MTEQALSYIRISTERQKDRYGPEMQEQGCIDYAKKNDLEITSTYQDEISGVVDFEDRTGGKRVLQALGNGTKHIVVYKLDRLSRPPENEEDVTELLLVCRLLRKRGATIHAVMDGGVIKFDTIGQLKLLLDGKKASEERRDTRIRVTDGKRTKAKQNKWVGSGQTPYGFRKEGKREDSRLVVYEPEAIWVREIFRLYVDAGFSLRRIAKHLDGVNAPKTANGRSPKYWSPTTIRWILQNPESVR